LRILFVAATTRVWTCCVHGMVHIVHHNAPATVDLIRKPSTIAERGKLNEGLASKNCDPFERGALEYLMMAGYFFDQCSFVTRAVGLCEGVFSIRNIHRRCVICVSHHSHVPYYAVVRGIPRLSGTIKSLNIRRSSRKKRAEKNNLAFFWVCYFPC